MKMGVVGGGGGGVQARKPFLGGVWMFSGTTQCET